MRRRLVVRTLGCVVLGLLGTVGMASAGRAADENQPAKPAEKAASAKESGAKKAGGRLPNYFSQIVDDAQKEKIYEVQKQYAARIASLQAELDKLTKERDDKILALLTPEQKKQLDELKATAKAARDGKRQNKGKSGKAASPSGGVKTTPTSTK